MRFDVMLLGSTLAAVQGFTAQQQHQLQPLSSSASLSIPPSVTSTATAADRNNKWILRSSTLDNDVETDSSPKTNDDANNSMSLGDRVANSGLASAAAMATAAVNAAVSMKSLEAPDVDKSYVALDKTQQEIDEEGLPIVYDKDLIQQYWSKERGALNQRWGTFVSKAVPFLTKVTTLFIRDGKINDGEIPALSRQARIDLQDLGPTFIKMGQMLSVRPDILPQPTLDELSKLQDSVVPFDSQVAVQQIEKELGGPLGQFFTSISEKPVAAASLAQVYLATLNDGNDTKVAVKIQRPSVLGTVSKDLYVLRRAAEVFQGLVERFVPQQRTNYVALLNEWAIGFYNELDFQAEAKNQKTLRNMLIEKNVKGVTVPKVYDEYCTRRLLVSEWMDGKKLSEASVEDIATVTPMAQEAFLTQLFEVGFFHADPHPGNLLLLNEPTKDGDVVALIDCGLMARIDSKDRDNMISTVVHLANKDYASLVDDFIKLGILPQDTNRPAVIPLMDKALSPYVKGGGAKKYEEELKKIYNMEDGNMQSQVGGFQAMTQDALTVMNDIPFSIPPYMAILGRAIVTLEGIALTGDPNYGIIMESYPFIARKLLSEDRPEIQSALQEVLYSSNDGDTSSGLKLSRLLALLNNAAGEVATQEGAAFVDLDAVPEDGITFAQGLKFLLSDKAESLRSLLEPEIDSIVDILSRQIFRQGMTEAMIALTPPRPPSIPLLGDILPPSPKVDEIPLPILLPSASTTASDITNDATSSILGRPSIAVMTLKDLTDIVAPKLSQDEELFALSIGDASREFFGNEVAKFLMGETVLSTSSAEIIIGAIRSGAIGRTDVFSPQAREAVINFASNALNLARNGRSSSSSSTTTTMMIEKELTDAIANLSDDEKELLDGIMDEIVQRSIQRVMDRLAVIDRVL